MFMVGAIRRTDCKSVDPIMKVYESSIRKAFRWQIDRGSATRRQTVSAATAQGKSRIAAENDAFDIADAAKDHARHVRRFHRFASTAGGFPQQTLEEIKRHMERSLLHAAGIISEPDEVIEGERLAMALWHNRPVPLDVGIWTQPPCKVCTTRTRHHATSDLGRREILASACLCDLE